MAKNLLIYHWTCSCGTPNATDLNSYQLIIDKDGKAIKGTNPSPASIAGLNTPAYNISFSAMCGYKSPKEPGKYQINQKMLESSWKEGAKFLLANHLTTDRVFTHSVIGEYVEKGTLTKHTGIAWNSYLKHNIGKIDIDYLALYPDLTRHQILDLFRKKISWYMEKIKSGAIK